MSYNFRETQLPNTFAKENIAEIAHAINLSNSLTVLSMPAVGASLFLKFLTSLPIAHFVYLDMYTLPVLSRRLFYAQLLKELGSIDIPSTDEKIIEDCKKQIAKLLETQKKVVIILNRFELLKNEFDNHFFGTLRLMQHDFENRLVFIFGCMKPYYEVVPDAITGGNLDMFAEYVYIKPFEKDDIATLLKLVSPEINFEKQTFEKAYELAGGHLQLIQLLLKSEHPSSPHDDPFITLLLKELFTYLSYEQRKLVQKIAEEKQITSDPTYLVRIGMLIKKDSDYKIFSPLLKEYIQQTAPLKLPIKEAKLLSLLKKNLGELVNKDVIFDEIWQNDPDNASDWALDSLIYRLRKNPSFQAKGYLIENYKKQGYMLIKN